MKGCMIFNQTVKLGAAGCTEMQEVTKQMQLTN